MADMSIPTGNFHVKLCETRVFWCLKWALILDEFDLKLPNPGPLDIGLHDSIRIDSGTWPVQPCLGLAMS